jgi:hypothetical protein
MNDVFLSYSREDQPRAQRLAAALEARGWKVWWDKLIVTGKTFDEVIQQALDDTRSVVVLWSETSTGSSWVKDEAAEGARRGVLVPCRIDDVRIPLGFGRLQTASLIDWDGEPDHPGFQQLCAAIAASIEASTARATARLATVPKSAGDAGPPVHAPMPTPAPAAAPRTPWRRVRASLVGLLTVTILGVGYSAFVGRDSAGQESGGGTTPAGGVSGAEVEPGTAGGPVPAEGGGEAAVDVPVEPAVQAPGEPTVEVPEETPSRQVWVFGLAFSQAVERAGGTHAVTSRESLNECGLISEGDTYVAWLKAGATGSKCQFQLNRDVRVRPACRIVAWDIEEPDSVRWITGPQVGADDPALEVRMWANPFQGRRKLKFRKWQLSVPADTPTYSARDLTLIDAPTLAERCLEAAA